MGQYGSHICQVSWPCTVRCLNILTMTLSVDNFKRFFSYWRLCVDFFFIKHESTRLCSNSCCDDIIDIITMKNTFFRGWSFHIWYQWNLWSIFWHFQKRLKFWGHDDFFTRSGTGSWVCQQNSQELLKLKILAIDNIVVENISELSIWAYWNVHKREDIIREFVPVRIRKILWYSCNIHTTQNTQNVSST